MEANSEKLRATPVAYSIRAVSNLGSFPEWVSRFVYLLNSHETIAFSTNVKGFIGGNQLQRSVKLVAVMFGPARFV